MSKPNQIKVLNRVPAPLLILTFLVMVLIPATFLKRSFLEFNKIAYQTSLNQSLPIMKNEMIKFKEDLKPDIWLGKKLKVINKLAGFQHYPSSEKAIQLRRFSTLNARSLAEMVEKTAKIKVAALIYHGPDTKNISVYKGINAKKSFRFPPKTLLKRALSSINFQHISKPLKFENNVNQLKTAFEELSPDLVAQKHMFLFQTSFGTIHPFQMSSEKVYKTISTKFGKTGPLFFHYSNATIKNGSSKSILGGYLVIFRLQDIPPKLVIKDAQKHELDNKYKRGFVFSKVKIPQIDKLNFHFTNEYLETKNSVFIRNVPSEQQIVHLIQRGTIVPSELSKVKKRFPYLAIGVSKNHLKHWLDKQQRLFYFLIKLLVLFAIFLASRICIFGLDFKASIKIKILFSSLFAGILPMAILSLNIAMHQQLNLASQQTLLKEQLEIEQTFVLEQIQNEIDYKKNQIMLISKKLEQCKSDRFKLFQSWLDNESDADEAIVAILSGAERTFVSKNASDKKFVGPELSALKIYLNSIIELIKKSAVLKNPENQENANFARNFIFKESEKFIQGEVLVNQSSIGSVDRTSPDFKFSSFLVFASNQMGIKIPIWLVSIRFNTFNLLEKIVTKIINSKKLTNNWKSLKIETFLLITESAQAENYHQFFPESSTPINMANISDQLKLARKNRVGMHFEIKFSDSTQHLYIKKHETWPIIFVSKTTIPKDFFLNKQSQIIPITSFLIALCFTILLLSQILYVNPLEKLIVGLKRIANGNLSSKIVLNSEDEFEGLAAKLNKMQKGLRDKRKLTQYVRADVLKEIESSSSVDLKPGGERIPTAILFLEIKSANPNIPLSFSQRMAFLEKLAQLSAEISEKFNGVIDKIFDNSIMIVFRNSPNEKNLATSAIKTAIHIINEFHKHNFYQTCIVQSGIEFGEVVSGKIGSLKGKLDYTVIGDAVNTAARLKSLTFSNLKNRILVTEQTSKITSFELKRKSCGLFQLKGKAQPIEVIDFWQNKTPPTESI
jgi:class 3 adenylate cyclase